MDWRDISILISILISLTAIFISLMPFLIDLCEDYGKPDWGTSEIFETVDGRLEELIEKYNVPTELQKDLGAVTDKYFLIEAFPLPGGWYYRIHSRRPDGTLGERKGGLEFYGGPVAVCESDELNEMCDAEVQAEPLKRRRRVMQDRFTSL
jgi:hypothetical protein